MDKDFHDHVEQALPEDGVIEEQNTGKLTKEVFLAYVAICAQVDCYIMTIVIPSSMLTYINNDLGPNPNSPWITISWQLGAAVFLSIGGRLSDIFGRRYFIMTGSIICTVGCLVGATAQSIGAMIVSGALFGIGAGFLELAYALVQEMIPNRYRLMAIGGLDISMAIAFTGPIVAFAIIAYYEIGWRGAYWYMFAFHVVSFLLVVFFYHPPDFRMKHESDGKGKWQLIKELDYLGILLFTAGCTLVLLGINFGGRTYPWTHHTPITLIVVGIFSLIALGFWSAYGGQRYPLMPPKLFRRIREFVMVICVTFCTGMLYYSMNVLWPKQSQIFFINSDRPLERGVWSIFFNIGTILSGIVLVTVCHRLPHEKWQLLFFVAGMTAFISSMASITVQTQARAIATVIISGLMVSVAQCIPFTIISLHLEDQADIGFAVSLTGTFKLLGGAVGTAVYTAILNTQFNAALPSRMISAIASSGTVLSNKLLSNLEAAAQVNTKAAYLAVDGVNASLADAAMQATIQAYEVSFKTVYLCTIAFGCLALLAASLVKETDRAKWNNERAVILKNELKDTKGQA
uniref:Major facilitator superfamily (MFS) profile domain-containing protein n=1 Tax=Bionectria ochroleuca TaxID=29856 RepID=A0A0B7KLS9_BIOOC